MLIAEGKLQWGELLITRLPLATPVAQLYLVKQAIDQAITTTYLG